MKKILLPLALMSALLVSCEPDGGDTPEYSISVSPAELTFGAEGGERSVTVTSSEDWYLDGESDWCKTSASYGESGDEILINIAPNADTENSRSAKLVFTCGDKTAELTINQQKDEIIEFKDMAFLQAILRDDEANADKNEDKKISKAEAALVTEMDIRANVYADGSSEYPQIRVMDEIKYFTTLRTLECSSNQLTSLDVSNNTALTWLNCGNNQLTSLDVSNNTALTRLYCNDNQLTSLDVSGCTALEELQCYGNQLTTINLINNTALMYLVCDDNQLTKLNVSNNTALTWLSCSENQLTILNVRNNTALTELSCYDNQLTTLDLSNNTALEYLYCHINQLTTLDLRNNRALTRLMCYMNPLQKIILYKYHIIDDYYIQDIQEEYGDIIEYAE